MTFAQFCMNRKVDDDNKINCYSDILPENERGKIKGLRQKHIETLRSIITEFSIEDDTYFEVITVLSDMSRFGPADQSYIFGRTFRGAWIVVEGDTIYIVGRGKASVSAVHSTVFCMKRCFREMDISYSWEPCYGM
jgi:hypothetical protein